MRPALRNGLVAAVVTTMVLAGATGSFANWSTFAQVASTPRAATLVIAATGVDLVDTYGNDTLTSTSTITVKNNTVTTSATVPSLTVTLSAQAGGDTTLSGALYVQAWSVANAAACTSATAVPSSGVTAGYWGSGVTVSGLTLAKNATATLCLRNTIADRTSVISPSGSRSFTPVATASLGVANFVGSTSATGTQTTQYIYSTVSLDRQNWYFIKPQNQTNCLDVEGGAVQASSGTTFISYPCKSGADTSNFIWNQLWTFLPAGSGYVEIKPRSGVLLRVDNSGTTTGSLSVKSAGALGGTASQLWQVQQASGGLYQFVNKATGLCMNVPTAAGDVSQASCSGAATQRFGIVSQSQIVLDSVACSITGTGTGRTLNYTWDSNDNGAYQLQYQAGTAWTTIATTPGARAAGISYGAGGAAGSTNGTVYQTRILDSFGTVVDTGSLRVYSNNTPWSCT